MNDSPLRRITGRACVLLAATTGVILGGAGPALADTAQAAAQAASVQLLGQPILSTGQVAATNDGSSQTKTGTSNPSLAVLGAQTLLSAGSLFQDAVAESNGTAAACAGVVGPNGTVQLGPSQSCLVSGAPTGVVVNLGAAVLRADAITAECTARSDGTVTGSATLVNARITDPTGVVTLLSLPVNPAPNTMLGLPGIVDITLNQQSSSAPGQISVTALDVTLLGGVGSGAQVRLGMVTCGPNAQTAPIPMFPSAGLPVAGATVLTGAGLVWLRRRRRSATSTDA